MTKKADRIVHSVSFPTAIHKVIEECAKREAARTGQPVTFGRFVVQAIMASLESNEIHNEVLNAINPDDRAAAQASFVEMLHNQTETIGNTMVRMDEHIEERFKSLENMMAYQQKMLSWVMYLIVYHLPDIPSDRKKEAAMSAMERLNKVISAVNKEFAQEQAKKAELVKGTDGNA